MDRAHADSHGIATLERPFELELADGSRIVPNDEVDEKPVRCEGDPHHAFTLADVQREGGEPFAGYRRVA
jgi:hypothetical protein